MTTEVIPVYAGFPHSLFDTFTNALDTSADPTVEVRAAYAYATVGGVQKLIDRVGKAERWNSTQKRVLVGVHNAVTEPAALEILRNIKRAEVRAFVPGGKLKQGVFASAPVFHPKVLALVTSVGLSAIQAGSPNLTSAAVGERPTNYELALSTIAVDGSSLDDPGDFEQWWTYLWDNSRPVNRPFIRRYAGLRQQVLDLNPILTAMIEVPETVKEAHHFFMEVGAGSGPPDARHQIEFPRALAEFFGEPEFNRRNLKLQQLGQIWERRPLTHKQTSYGVDIWRLGMPTTNSGGPPIVERAIRFTRTGEPDTFDFEVADIGSTDFRSWEEAANLSGHLGSTHGLRARKYGFY